MSSPRISRKMFVAAYDRAKAYLLANPNKWTKSRMFDPATCSTCISGRMAVELGVEPRDMGKMSSYGWALSDKLHEKNHLGFGIVSINDTSPTVKEAFARLDPMIAPFR